MCVRRMSGVAYSLAICRNFLVVMMPGTSKTCLSPGQCLSQALLGTPKALAGRALPNSTSI